MIADTEDGILIDGVGSFSIDQQRRNFQFGGDAFWKVEKGKVVGMLKDVTYQAMTTDFWNQIDAIGRLRNWFSAVLIYAERASRCRLLK